MGYNNDDDDDNGVGFCIAVIIIKMQKSIRANEHQLYYLVNKARENGLAKLSGNLWKRSLDTGKWQLR
ncbi:hypothetical protein Smp_127760 [Schistosoma mansoni]|uniref:hypothetical protein n=1 Tax=Schistosoma mansoni TaxID=6183 RepID=UPI00022DC79A|nr:hypothetical protein Smp_127760 [Schistosoma mansoni]|eukprot:XP_018653516.1 hypothetical protein Smp_127760 [Schistosoma mansoni]